MQPTGRAEDLCLSCGLCCNGVIFADVRLQPGDDTSRLEALGLPLFSGGPDVKNEAHSRRTRPSSRGPKFPQPCVAFRNGCCAIYAERPVHCASFDCVLLQNVKERRLTPEAALKTIQTAKEQSENVLTLIRKLGDHQENLPLTQRFRLTSKKLEAAPPDDSTAEIYGELTLAMHDLNCLLSESFYPGD